jgi:hypothetical protein
MTDDRDDMDTAERERERRDFVTMFSFWLSGLDCLLSPARWRKWSRVGGKYRDVTTSLTSHPCNRIGIKS